MVQKEKISYNTNDTRTIYKFLWFPVTIGKETRWLEKALIFQIYEEYDYVDIDTEIIFKRKRWQNTVFRNE